MGLKITDNQKNKKILKKRKNYKKYDRFIPLYASKMNFQIDSQMNSPEN